jgi:hypothetical protein
MPSNLFSGVTSFLSGLLKIIPGMNSVAGQVAPFCVCVAFVLLVFGCMRGFLQNDTRHFFGNLVRIVILVALIGNSQTLESAIENAVSAFCNLQVSSGFSSNSNGAGRLDLSGLFGTIAQKAIGANGSQNVGSQNALQQIISTINTLTHPLCLILYGIYVLALLLCEFIAAGMNVLQQCIIIFLNLYVPIGFAEFSIPSLRGQAETFFKAYIGVECWPVGWVLANIVTVNLLQGITPPNPEDAGALVLAIILCVPLVLWMVIGYVLAPFYVQKVVMRGGAELQAFAGAMISAVGGTSAAVYGGAFAMAKSATLGLSQGIGAIKNPIGRGISGAQQTNNASNQGNGSNGQQGIGLDDVLDYLLPGYRAIEQSGGSNGGPADRARNLGGWGLSKAMDAGEFAARTAGSMANTLGALVADASGNRIGPERNFLPQIKRNSQNRSSRRAADYLNQSTPSQSNPDQSIY